jgi:hypothetical protein
MIPVRTIEVAAPDKDPGEWVHGLVDAYGDGNIDVIVDQLRVKYPGCGIRLVIFNFQDYRGFSTGCVRRALKEFLRLNYELGAALCKRILFHRRRQKKEKCQQTAGIRPRMGEGSAKNFTLRAP